MPAVLSSVAQFQETPLGQQLTGFTNNLASGTLDQLLFAASNRVNRFCKRKLGASPLTSVGTAGAATGAQSVPLATVVNVLEGDAVVFPSTSETIQITGADVAVPATPPYAGTILLQKPLANSYTSGASAQIYRQDYYQVRGKESVQGEALYPISQEGQVALAHSPVGAIGLSSRKITLREYPIWAPIQQAWQSLFWGNTEEQADLSGAYIDSDHGWIRLVIGAFNPVLTMWRIIYSAGYADIPYDVRDATHSFMAAEIVRAANPYGALAMRNADLQMSFPGSSSRGDPLESLHIAAGERTLAAGGWRRVWA